MDFFKSKKKGVITITEYNPYSSSPPSSKLQDMDVSGYSSLLDFERKDRKYKSLIRYLRFTTRTVSVVLSAYMIYSMTFTLIIYYRTRSHNIDNVSVWGAPKNLWPTYLVLSIATISLAMNLATLAAYLCAVAAANKSGDFTIFAGYVMLGVEIIVWAISSGLYKYADTGTDLWGYTCGTEKDQFVGRVESFVNFGKLCTTQNVTWIACLVQTAFHVLTLVTLIFIFRRASGKERIEKIRESQVLGNVYGSGAPMETVYNPGIGRTYMPVSGFSSKA